MDSWSLLSDVLVLLAAAFILGAVCERLRQSAVLGYLVAGTLLGPHALGWVSSQDGVEVLAELGVATLLFTIGLEFSWARLKGLGGPLLLSGLAQVTGTIALATGIGWLLGLSGGAALVVGSVVTLSSTATVLRILAGRGEVDSVHGRSALAILLVQDLAMIPLVILVTALSGEGSPGEIAGDLARTLGMAAGLVVAIGLLAHKIVPFALGAAPLQRNRELPVLLAAVAGLGSAWGAHQAGLSPAVGAFLAGMLLGGSPFATQIRADVGVLRTLLITLFFGSIGMLSDLAWIVGNLPKVLGVVVAVLIGKSLVIWAVLRIMRLGNRHAFAVGLCLSQVGEFSFVLAMAAEGTLLGPDLFRLMVSVTIVTLFLTPALVSVGPALVFRFAARARGGTGSDPGPRETAPRGQVVVIGFGPAGQAAASTLLQASVPTTIVDLNPRSAARARELGCAAVIGDATHQDVLEHARVETAAAVVVTVPDPESTRTLVALVRAMAPHATVVARCRYHVWRQAIEMAGAQVVLDEEQEVGARLAEELDRLISGGAADADDRAGTGHP